MTAALFYLLKIHRMQYTRRTMKKPLLFIFAVCLIVAAIGAQGNSTVTSITTEIRSDATVLILTSTVQCTIEDSTQLRLIRINEGDDALINSIKKALSSSAYYVESSVLLTPENPLSFEPITILTEIIIQGHVLFAHDTAILQYPIFATALIKNALVSSCSEQITLQCPKGYIPLRSDSDISRLHNRMTITFNGRTLFHFISCDSADINSLLETQTIFLHKKDVSQ